MSKEQIMTGGWADGKNKIKCKLPLIIFEEDNNIITFCPALDLSGYGATEEEAKRSFEITLSEYFNYTVHKKTLVDDLKKHGWTIKKNLRKPAIPPTMQDLLQNNHDFNRIFNNFNFKKKDATIDIPALV